MQSSLSGGAVAPWCALCSQPIAPDLWGLMECPCGWGGPDDPLEAARGPGRMVMRIDRRLANGQARRDLRRLATTRWQPGRLGFAYTLVLLFGSTLIYVLVGALILGSLALTVKFIFDGAWLGAILYGIVAIATGLSLFQGRVDVKGVPAPRGRFPRLWSIVDEVSERIRDAEAKPGGAHS